jgi:hypothetical protein
MYAVGILFTSAIRTSSVEASRGCLTIEAALFILGSPKSSFDDWSFFFEMSYIEGYHKLNLVEMAFPPALVELVRRAGRPTFGTALFFLQASLRRDANKVRCLSACQLQMSQRSATGAFVYGSVWR